MHLQNYDLPYLGKEMSAGEDTIGYVGSTGTYAAHLHISISENSSWSDDSRYTGYYIDPVAFIKDWDASQN